MYFIENAVLRFNSVLLKECGIHRQRSLNLLACSLCGVTLGSFLGMVKRVRVSKVKLFEVRVSLYSWRFLRGVRARKWSEQESK